MSDLFSQCFRIGAVTPGKMPAGLALKIGRLVELIDRGFRVPEAWAIPAGVVEVIIHEAGHAARTTETGLVRGLFRAPAAMECFHRLWEAARAYAPLILRSAVDTEDRQSASFAGVFRSVKDIGSLDELVQAFAECWMSVQQAPSGPYPAPHDGRPPRLSLLLQQYIAGDFSGVTFTVDPLTPVEHQLKIEAIAGPCEAVTAGTTPVSSWCFDWRDQRLHPLNGGEVAIASGRLTAVANSCLDIQRFFGAPQDIEWTMRDDDLFILQSRPIGRLNVHDRYIWTNANFRDGGIGARMPSPLMWSLYSFTFEQAIEHFTRATTLTPDPKPEQWTKTFFGYPYWNLTSTKAGSQKVIGYVERQFDIGQGVDPYYEGDGHVARLSLFSLVTSLRALFAITRSIRGRFERCREARDYFHNDVLRRFEATTLHTLSRAELTDYLAHLIEVDLRFLYGRYWEIIYDNTFLNNFLLNSLERYKRRTKQTIDFADVVSGIDDIAHIRPLRALWELRERIAADPPAGRFWQERPVEEIVALYRSGASLPHGEGFDEIISRFPYKSEHELEISIPDWREDPSPAVSLLQGLLRDQTESPLEKMRTQQQQFLRRRRRISSRSLLKKIDRQRKLLWWKEEIRDLTTHLFHLIRQVVRQLEMALIADGLLEREGDIFFLPFGKLLALARGFDAPLHREVIRYNRIIRESFRNFDKPNLIFPEEARVHTPATGAHFQGIGVSPGVIRGRALLVADPDKALERLTGEGGQVLVTSHFNPSQLPLVNRTRAIVTANGGMLSHGAIICREFGIPAVFGISGILDGLRQDDWIEINGQAGTVKILSHDGSPAVN